MTIPSPPSSAASAETAVPLVVAVIGSPSSKAFIIDPSPSDTVFSLKKAIELQIHVPAIHLSLHRPTPPPSITDERFDTDLLVKRIPSLLAVPGPQNLRSLDPKELANVFPSVALTNPLEKVAIVFADTLKEKSQDVVQILVTVDPTFHPVAASLAPLDAELPLYEGLAASGSFHLDTTSTAAPSASGSASTPAATAVSTSSKGLFPDDNPAALAGADLALRMVNNPGKLFPSSDPLPPTSQDAIPSTTTTQDAIPFTTSSVPKEKEDDTRVSVTDTPRLVAMVSLPTSPSAQRRQRRTIIYSVIAFLCVMIVVIALVVTHPWSPPTTVDPPPTTSAPAKVTVTVPAQQPSVVTKYVTGEPTTVVRNVTATVTDQETVTQVVFTTVETLPAPPAPRGAG
ncbi:hypothetical protein HK101_002197, partial [Irineochytrium annulatum]